VEPSFSLWGKPVLCTALREDLAWVEKAQKRTEEESDSWKRDFQGKTEGSGMFGFEKTKQKSFL